MLKLSALPSLRQVTQWHVRSQHVARRNALMASTALADRRRQRIEVEEFLESYSRSRESTPPRELAGWR